MLKCSSNDRVTDLSTLACQRRTSECVAWRCSPDPAGTQKTYAPSWESTGGHLELSLSPPRYTSTHRACCGEGVGPIGPAGVKKQRKRNIGQKSMTVKRTAFSTAEATPYEMVVIIWMRKRELKKKGKGKRFKVNVRQWGRAQGECNIQPVWHLLC